MLDGRAFGLAGGYEKISGRVYFALDPKIDANLIITDIDKAPVNENGLVEFSSEFYILKPKAVERGNGSGLSIAWSRRHSSSPASRWPRPIGHRGGSSHFAARPHSVASVASFASSIR